MRVKLPGLLSVVPSTGSSRDAGSLDTAGSPAGPKTRVNSPAGRVRCSIPAPSTVGGGVIGAASASLLPKGPPKNLVNSPVADTRNSAGFGLGGWALGSSRGEASNKSPLLDEGDQVRG